MPYNVTMKHKRGVLKLLERYLYTLPLISAALLGLTLLSTKLTWLVFVALVPLLYVVAQPNKLNRKHVMRSFYAAGVVYFLFVYMAMLDTSPNSWSQIDSTFATLSTGFVWIVLALTNAVQFLLLGWATLNLEKRYRLLLLPCIWILAELARSYLFAAIALGPGGTLSPNWPLGNLGTIAAGTPLVYLGRFIGLYGLSLAVVSINIGVLLALKKKQKAALLLAGPAALALLAFVAYQPSGNTIKAAAVHLADKSDLRQTVPNISLPVDAELLVLPEYSRFLDNPNHKKLAGRSVVVTTVEGIGKPRSNDLIYYSAQAGEISRQQKTFLISGGEYAPYIFDGMFRLLGRSYIVTEFNQSQQVRPGTSSEKPVRTTVGYLGGLACSGVINLSQYQRLTRKGAEILVNPASLSLISSGNVYHVQEQYLTRFHAVANARPFVQASRTGESYILNSNGTKQAFANGNNQLISAEVRLSSRRTLYTLVGEFLPFVAAVFMLAAVRLKRSTSY